jgi:hypothetical protein
VKALGLQIESLTGEAVCDSQQMSAQLGSLSLNIQKPKAPGYCAEVGPLHDLGAGHWDSVKNSRILC